jgi:hypothetical protein
MRLVVAGFFAALLVGGAVLTWALIWIHATSWCVMWDVFDYVDS